MNQNSEEDKKIEKDTKKKEEKTTNQTVDATYHEVGTRPSKKNSSIPLVVIIVVVVMVVIGIVAAFHGGLFDFAKTLTSKSNANVELKYTDTYETSQNGIYITDVSEVVENVMPSIVSITSKTLVSSGQFGPQFFGYGEEQYTEGAGSGIIISKSDTELLILTNNHVVEGAKELSVQFINEKSYDATVKGTSERKDVAVIAVSLEKLDEETIAAIKIATLGDSNTLKVGNGVIAIGNALGYGQSVTTGVVSALNREVTVDNYTNPMIQLDAAINGGNSGGALLNSSGEVIGINSVKYSSTGSSTTASVEGMGFAIPISDVKELITALMNGEEDEGGATIGVEGYIVTQAYSQAYGVPIGFYISKISEGSGAEKASLEIGNIITKIEDREIEAISDLQSVLSKKNKGDEVKLTIQYASGREYKEKEVTVTLS